MFQTRTGQAALELDPTGPHAGPPLEAVADAARLDAYAVLPGGHRQSLSDAVAVALPLALPLAETELGHLLQDGKAAPDNPPEEVPQPT
ncbi:hypothetical protein ACFRH4_06795 [Streptomyces mirabilis]|uniref:hypothetical protein n=1 Tax=Streptomyces mirabilis TaxID=68239 RepID=UPI0036C28A8F